MLAKFLIIGTVLLSGSSLPIVQLGNDSDYVVHFADVSKGQVRVDSWVNDQVDDTENSDMLQAEVNPVAINKVQSIHVNVVRMEDENNNVWTRKINSYITDYVPGTVGEECGDLPVRQLRTRANISIFWTDGTQSIVTTLSNLSQILFCKL